MNCPQCGCMVEQSPHGGSVCWCDCCGKVMVSNGDAPREAHVGEYFHFSEENGKWVAGKQNEKASRPDMRDLVRVVGEAEEMLGRFTAASNDATVLRLSYGLEGALRQLCEREDRVGNADIVVAASLFMATLTNLICKGRDHNTRLTVSVAIMMASNGAIRIGAGES